MHISWNDPGTMSVQAKNLAGSLSAKAQAMIDALEGKVRLISCLLLHYIF